MAPGSPLFEIDAALEPDLRVYRTLDFFSAAAIVSQRRLMFSRADTFEDKNEGIERLLLQLEVTSPDSGAWRCAARQTLGGRDAPSGATAAQDF